MRFYFIYLCLCSMWKNSNLTSELHRHTLFFSLFRGRVSHELQGPKESSYLRRIHHIQVQSFALDLQSEHARVSNVQTAWQMLVVSELFCWCVAKRSERLDYFNGQPRFHPLHLKNTRLVFLFKKPFFSPPLSCPFICNFLTILNGMARCKRPSAPLSNSQTALS